jgi:hypothetical protein
MPARASLNSQFMTSLGWVLGGERLTSHVPLLLVRHPNDFSGVDSSQRIVIQVRLRMLLSAVRVERHAGRDVFENNYIRLECMRRMWRIA